MIDTARQIYAKNSDLRLKPKIKLNWADKKITMEEFISFILQIKTFCTEIHPEFAGLSLKTALADDTVLEALYTEKVVAGKLVSDINDKGKGRFKDVMRDISKYMLSKTASKVMDPQKKIEICISAAEKIQKLHDAGYLHCDIKGENFLVDEKTGEVFLLDYGAAYPIDNLSSNTALFGTETYVAPEVGDNIKTRWLQSVDGQLQEISDIDLSKVPKGSSDVYSFGRFLEADMGLKRSDLCGIVSNVLSRDPSERPTMPQIIDILKLYKALALEVSAEPEKVAKMLLKNGTREQFALVDERLYDIMHPSEPKTASQKLAELGAIADSDTVAPFSAVRQQCIEAIKSDCMSRVQEIMSVMFTPAHTPSKRLTVEDLESSVIDKVHQKTIGDADDDERDEVDEEAELGRTSQFK